MGSDNSFMYPTKYGMRAGGHPSQSDIDYDVLKERVESMRLVFCEINQLMLARDMRGDAALPSHLWAQVKAYAQKEGKA